MVYILPKEGSPTVDCNKLCEKHFPTWRTMQVLLILVNSFSCDIPSMLQKWLSHVVSQGFWSILGQRKDLDKWPVHQRVNTHRHHLVSPILHLLGLWGTWTTQKNKQISHRKAPWFRNPNLDLLAVRRQCYPHKYHTFAILCINKNMDKIPKIWLFYPIFVHA